MGKKRAYQSRKTGGGRKKLKPEYDAEKNLKEQMESAVALYNSEMSLQAIYGMFYRFGLIDVPDEVKEKMKNQTSVLIL